MRREVGEQTTVFERINDGRAVVSKGDVVRLATKGQVAGRVLHFSVSKVSREQVLFQSAL